MARDDDYDDEDENEPAPRRRRRRDDERRPRSRDELTGLDGMFAKTNIVLLVLFGLCCNGIALILGIVGLATCKDPQARQNALIVTIIGAIMAAAGAGIQIFGLLGKR